MSDVFWRNYALTTLGHNDTQSFLFLLGPIALVALVIAVWFKAGTTWAITHFAQMRDYSIARPLVAGYLAQSYERLLNRQSAGLGKDVLGEGHLVAANALMPMTRLLIQGAVVISHSCAPRPGANEMKKQSQ